MGEREEEEEGEREEEGDEDNERVSMHFYTRDFNINKFSICMNESVYE